MMKRATLLSAALLLAGPAWAQQEAVAPAVGLQLFFQGAMLLMCCYNLLYFFMVRDRAYLYYALYILCMALVSAVNAYEGFREIGHPAELATNIAALFLTFCYVQFVRYFLHTSREHPSLDRYLGYWAAARLGIALLAVAAYWQTPASIVESNALQLVFLLDMLLGLGLLYKSWAWNRALAGYIILGYLAITLPLSGAIVKQLLYGSADPASDGVLVQFGVLAELVLFSLGLGYRSRLSEQGRLAALEANQRMVQEQNALLERLVAERTDALDQSLRTVSKQRDNIISSIQYALRIQRAILPNEAELRQRLDAFVLFRPRDIVSGDFYWFAEKGGATILAVADCTGHGVSGAFMTMIGNALLHQVVRDEGIEAPEAVLNRLPALLEQTLQHSDGTVKDGMDLALVRLAERPDGWQVQYAGAMNPLYAVVNGEWAEWKADKRPIGGKALAGFSYRRHDLHFPRGTMIYLCSDGFQDQFGGAEDRKFMVGKFKKLLAGMAGADTAEQRRLLEQAFDDWKADRPQTDDVLVVGIRLG